MNTIVCNYDCEEIFDPTYVPAEIDEEETFKEKQKFIYLGFEDKVLTNMRQVLVRIFKDSDDAQSKYKGLL